MKRKLNKHSDTTEYENKSLLDYHAKYFHYDKIRYGLSNLQPVDTD